MLPLGTQATVKLVSNKSGRTQKLYQQDGSYSYTWNASSQYSQGLHSVKADGVMRQETNDVTAGSAAVALLDPNGTMYADIANATGAKAIVCIKY